MKYIYPSQALPLHGSLCSAYRVFKLKWRRLPNTKPISLVAQQSSTQRSVLPSPVLENVRVLLELLVSIKKCVLLIFLLNRWTSVSYQLKSTINHNVFHSYNQGDRTMLTLKLQAVLCHIINYTWCRSFVLSLNQHYYQAQLWKLTLIKIDGMW